MKLSSKQFIYLFMLSDAFVFYQNNFLPLKLLILHFVLQLYYILYIHDCHFISLL